MRGQILWQARAEDRELLIKRARKGARGMNPSLIGVDFIEYIVNYYL